MIKRCPMFDIDRDAMSYKQLSRCLAFVVIAFVLAITVSAIPGYAQAPVGWWMFDDGTGATAEDSAGGSHPITLVNGASWTTGKIAGAISAGGTNQYGTMPAIDLSGTKAVTVAMWVNRTYSITGGSVLFENTPDYNGSTTGFAVFPDDNSCVGLQAAVRGDVGYTANCYAQPSSGVWHHLVFVFDKTQAGAAEVTFYLDGVLQTASSSQAVATNTNSFGNNPTYLCSRGGASQFTAATVDDLRIYTSALSLPAIQALYNGATLSSVAVTPANSSIPKGVTQQFVATGTYGDGSTHNLTSYSTWASSATSVATIAIAGTATALSPGSTTITATAAVSPVSGSTSLIVTAPSLVSIAVVPTSAVIVQGSTQQFTATGGYSDGTTQNLSGTANWSSTNTAVASVSSTGLATAVAKGTAGVQASMGGVSGSATVSVTAPLVSISLTPANGSIAKGTTQQFIATGKFSDGTSQNLTTVVSWSSSNTIAASISATGLATGAALGRTTIGAASGSITGATNLFVTAPTVTAITVTPTSGSIIQGGAEQLTATGTYSDGTTQNITALSTWTSTSPIVASVSGSGLSSGLAVGSTNIEATYNSITGGASLSVAAPIAGLAGYWTFDEGIGTIAHDTSGSGDTATFFNGITWTTGQIGNAIFANAASKQYLNIPSVDLSSTSSVTTAFWFNHTYSTTGGHALIEASANYNSSTTGFAVFPDDDSCTGIQAAVHGNVGYTAVCFAQPTSGVWHHLTFVFDKTQTGAAQVKFYLDGMQQTATKSLVTSNNSGAFGANPIYLFSRGGTQLFTSGKMDDLRIYNSALAQSQVQEIYTGAMLVALSVTPANALIPIGSIQQFSATGTYGDGSTHSLTGVGWTSSNGNATINASGLAAGVTQGTSTVQATLGSITGATSLAVVAPSVVSISIAPSTPSIVKGSTLQFTATATYSDGSTQNVTNTASWNSTNTTVVSISSTGLGAGVGVGTSTIQATSGSITGTAQATVTLALVSIAIVPANATVAKGNTLQLAATGTYSDNSTQNITSSVTWSSSSPAIASISTGGIVTGAGLGTATIAAASGATSGSSGLTVTVPTLLSISITPANSLMSTNATSQFTATGTYSDGSTQNITASSTWTSSNSAAATINANGLVTSLAVGNTTIAAALGSINASTNLSIVSGTFPYIPYDMYIDFEHDSVGAAMNATELAASTHGVAGAWSVLDPGNLLTTQSAAQEPSNVLTGDTGNRGIAYDLANGGTGNIQWGLPASQSTLSFGLWYKTGQPGPWIEGPHFVTLYNWGTGNLLRLSDERSSGNNARQIRVSPLDSAVPVTDNTWYWLTMKWTQQGVGTFNVYDTFFNLIGSVNFTDAFNSPVQAILLGNTSNTAGQPGITTYYDDFIIDYTNANFPLLPRIPDQISVSANPVTIVNGASSTGVVSLSMPAPAGGVTVLLASSNSAVASVPSQVFIPAGQTSTTFSIIANGVTFSTSVTLTATYGSLTGTGIVTVIPTVMAQVAVDGFSRADSSTLGSNWTPLLGATATSLQVNHNQVQSTALSPAIGKEMYYGGLTWGPDQYSGAQVVAASGNGYAGPSVRMTSNDTHYACVVSNTGVNSASVAILRDLVGTYTTLASSNTASVSAGDTVRCMVQGNALTFLDQTTSTILLTATDTSITAGYPGLVVSAGSANLASYSLMNWTGGDLAAPLALQQVANDTFARANAADLGANWHVGPGHGAIQIVGQMVEPYPAGGIPPSKEHYVAAGVFPNDQWSQLQIDVEDVLGDNAVELRASDVSDTLYVLDVNLTGAPGIAETRIATVVNGTITPLVIDQTWSAVNPGDYIRGQVNGNLLSLIDVTTGSLLLSATDSTILSGYPGISMQVLNGSTVDHVSGNWSGGLFQ
jgi:Concanavalin A-like lectin/glucanases superfamily/Bacterial Ig-like domain (group 2)